MLKQEDYDRISNIKEQDFITIMTAIEGGVDWEMMVILYARSQYEYALQLLKGGWQETVSEHEAKADKALNYLNTFRKLNN